MATLIVKGTRQITVPNSPAPQVRNFNNDFLAWYNVTIAMGMTVTYIKSSSPSRLTVEVTIIDTAYPAGSDLALGIFELNSVVTQRINQLANLFP